MEKESQSGKGKIIEEELSGVFNWVLEGLKKNFGTKQKKALPTPNILTIQIKELKRKQ